MAALRTLVFAAVLVAAAIPPCVLVCYLLYAFDLADDDSPTVRLPTESRLPRWMHRRGVASTPALPASPGSPAAPGSPAWPASAVDPPIEQIAAHLRRLERLRAKVANRSNVWFTAVSRAHDAQLQAACRRLGVAEHLGELAGTDLEIERVRVEGELLAAGLVLHDEAATPPRYGQQYGL